MSVVIKGVTAGSPAQRAGIKAGDTLLKINSNEIVDVLDYRFYQVETVLKLTIKNSDGKTKTIKVKKDEYEELGLEFETYLMDKQQHCKNKCIFCFIDQLPKGMRKSLYFKDDDSRLSFLFGNYITLTNLTQHEIDRIIKLHISPINISVHTMDKQLREFMMGNKFAGEALSTLYKLAENNIKINCQIVLCPEINDGDNLKYTLNKLGELYPSVENIAIVPVGLTKFRDGLYPLRVFNESEAKDTISIVESFAEDCFKKFGTRIAYCADEFYFKAGKPIPPCEYYEDLMQLENGVGLIALLKSEFDDALSYSQYKLNKERVVTIATGKAPYECIKELADSAMKKFTDLKCNVIEIENRFFGENITVTGLITGGDLLNQLEGKNLGEELLISKSMLKYGQEVFLDDVTVSDIEKGLNVKVTVVENNGDMLLSSMLGE